MRALIPRRITAISREITVAILIAALLLIPVVYGQSGRVQSTLPKRPTIPVQDPQPTPPPVKPPPSDPKDDPKDDPKEETIRIASDLVTVIANVSVDSSQQISPLSIGDFEILEDGVPQEIVNFTRDSAQPMQLAMLFDASLSVAQKLDFERKAMLRFFDRVLRPQDRAALFAVSTDVTLLQEFTSKPSLLSQASRQLKAQGATSLYDGVYLAAEYLKPVEGRHIMVIVSDGSDTTSQKGLLAALDKAQQADAMIYAVYTGNFGISQNLRDLAGERALETLTRETGGELFRPQATPGSQTDEVDEQSLRQLDFSFSRLAEQLRTQYLLSFYSSNEKRDGAFRKLTVRVRRPGFRVRSRAGYFAKG